MNVNVHLAVEVEANPLMVLLEWYEEIAWDCDVRYERADPRVCIEVDALPGVDG